jgi:hypothetical protein
MSTLIYEKAKSWMKSIVSMEMKKERKSMKMRWKKRNRSICLESI